MNESITIEDDASFSAPVASRKFEPSSYQLDIFNWIESGSGDAIVNAVAGCLAADTLIGVNRAGKSFKCTIAHLHHMFNGGSASGKIWDTEILTYVRCLKEKNIIGLGRLGESVFSGYKCIYEVETLSGKRIKATADHRFLVADEGWQPLENLRVGQMLLSEALRVKGQRSAKKHYDRVFGLHAHPFQTSIGARDGVVPKHRIVYEAYINDLTFDEFVQLVREHKTEGLKFIDPSEQTVHHGDENHKNNELSNLELLGRLQHYQIHAVAHGWETVQFKVGLDPIVSITRLPVGVEATYDLTMYDGGEEPNFLANGIVVHNSGKTTTLVEASKRLPGSSTSIFCAFNSHIVKELTSRLQGMECKTIHSIGLACLARHFDSQPKVDANKYRALVRKKSWKLAEQMPTVSRQELTSALGDLVDLAQATLVFSYVDSFSYTEHIGALSSLVQHFGIQLPCSVEKIAPSVHSVLQQGILRAKEEQIISFSDMLWLPWVWELAPRTYDWVFVDECQDLNRAQLEMVVKLRAKPHIDRLTTGKWKAQTGRMIFVGDPRQAIYGFSGADASSYRNIQERTRATEFPLSVSYRCPVLVVREAQAIVPGIQARKDAELGSVRWISETALYGDVREGDLILCRMTAPLIATCLDLIRQKVPARVRGKDIGKMLVKTVQIVSERSGFTFSQFPKHLRDYTSEQVGKLKSRDDSESQMERLYDLESALLACFDGHDEHSPYPYGIDEFKDFIAGLFSDDRPGVWLSTVHKAKGLEAERVFILRPDKLPLVWKGQQAWETEQEWNLRYVAITRSLSELIYVRQAGETL